MPAKYTLLATSLLCLIPAITIPFTASAAGAWPASYEASRPGKARQPTAADLSSSDAATTAASQYLNIFSYQHNLTLGQQQRSLVATGSSLRLRRLLADLAAGRNASIGILGGSVSWGFYMQRGVTDWFARFTTWLQQAFPAATVSSKNGCVPATTTEYASMCLERFVDTANVDLVFLEYSLNDGYVDTSVRTEHAMAFERLIRKLLQLPRRPAVVLMQVLPQGIRSSDSPLFWWSVQDHYGVLAQYYQLPWLSMRDAMWHEVVSGAPGFTVREIYPEQEQDMQRHPSELGHKYMADAAVAMMQQVYLDMLLEPVPLDGQWGNRLLQVPEPMFENNYESSNLACFVGDSLPAVVTASQGWSWRNDGTAEKPKWGYSTTTVGAVLQLKLDTRMTAGPATTAAVHPGSSTPSPQPADTTDSRGTDVAQAAPEQHGSSGDGQAGSIDGSTDDSHLQPQHSVRAQQQGGTLSTAYAAMPGMQPAEPTPALRLEQGASAASESGGRHLRQTATAQPFISESSAAALDSALSQPAEPLMAPPSTAAPLLQERAQLGSAPQPGGAAQQRAQRLLQQAGDHSSAWWEAQHSQEEQQERSKLQESNRGWQAGDILVWVGYTKTWRGAGRAVMSCGGGCSCKNFTVDGHHRWKTTQSYMAKLYTQQAADCIIQVEVLPQTSSNGTYFKVSGLMASRRISSYDGGDYTDVLLMNAMEGEDYKLKTEG